MWINEAMTSHGFRVFEVQCEGLGLVCTLAVFGTLSEAADYIRLNSGVEIN